LVLSANSKKGSQNVLILPQDYYYRTNSEKLSEKSTSSRSRKIHETDALKAGISKEVCLKKIFDA
jgi:hypothetical protein